LVVGNDAQIAERIDAIAYPGLTANFDAGKVAALAVTLADWKKHGSAYAHAMCDTARALAQALHRERLPVYAMDKGATTSHQFAVEAARWGGGQAAAKRMARAGLLACGIGLPIAPLEGDVNGLRLGVPEIVRLGMKPEHMDELGALIARALGDHPDHAAPEVEVFRRRFRELHYIN
jgi:glycine hydroxymethyltransferase